MKWNLLDRGFLPTPDPLARIENGPYAHIEQLGRNLPELVQRRSFRDVAPKALAAPRDFGPLTAADQDALAERLFLLYSYIASAYIHAPGLPAASRLPRPIAVPLVELSRICQRPPILSYASYCLHNWRRLDSNGPIALGNIALTQNFSMIGDGRTDEDWFILVHVDIEARAGAVLSAMQSLPAAIAAENGSALECALAQIHGGLRAMNRTLARMPEGCSAEVYFRKVRPYIFGFDNVVYEGCFGDVPQSLRGETGAQSSIIPAVNAALGIRHQDSLLTRHLDDMRNYMPLEHRRFIESQVSVRERVRELAGQGSRAGSIKELYNACVAEVIAFRSRHFEYAVNYIQKKVDNPLATGGTPYITWLKQLIVETETHYL